MDAEGGAGMLSTLQTPNPLVFETRAWAFQHLSLQTPAAGPSDPDQRGAGQQAVSGRAVGRQAAVRAGFWRRQLPSSGCHVQPRQFTHYLPLDY